jgi:uncharacterized protein DUF2867
MTRVNRVRRVEAPERTRMLKDIPDADYTCAFEITRPATDQRTAEQWSRAVFEGPPMPVRAFLTAGWRLVLGLRLGPRPAAGHVLGWRIRSAHPDLLMLEQASPLITAHNVAQVDDTRVVWTTFVGYRNLFGRVLWALALPFHISTIPRLLRYAARES